MPRLIGKRANPVPAIALAVLAVIGIGISLEYLGYTNLFPRFGQPQRYESR